jgi:L-fucose mutarotase
MLKHNLLHPQILNALARAGHSSKILISDGNYPHYTRKGPNADLVFLNLAPGQLLVTDILKALLTAVPIEDAAVMDYARTGPYALPADPPIWSEFRSIIKSNNYSFDLTLIERFKFYDTANGPDVTLAIASGDQRIYANLLLTIGVVMPK